MMKQITPNTKKFKEIMASHARWIDNKPGATRARFEDVKFSGNFTGFDFSYVKFKNVKADSIVFENCKFNSVNFESCCFRRADFNNCEFINCETEFCVNFYGASFDKCNFTGAQFSDAIFGDAYFYNCKFYQANLSNADFRNAELCDCDLTAIRYDELTAGIALACPEKGAFTAFKKAELYNGDNCIVELQVPADALRSSATTRKCRVSKAKVIAVYRMDGTPVKQNAYSMHANSFTYRIGKMVEVKKFDKDRWNECSTGIHCFITKKEAELYF